VRFLLSVAASTAALLAVSCGGGGGEDSPTPGAPAPTVAGDTDEPAEFVVIFGGPELSREVLAAAKGEKLALLLGSASIGDGVFNTNSLPDAETRGASLGSTPRDNDFEVRYAEKYELPDPEPPGFREAYDAVYLVAAAAAAANSGDPAAVREHIYFAANPPGADKPSGPKSFGSLKKILEQESDVNLSGGSGLVDIDSDGVATKGAVETWAIINGAPAPLDTRDVDLTVAGEAQNPAGVVNRGDGATAPLKIGAVLPLTGDDGGRGQAIQSAIQLAVDEINEGGGAAGQPLEVVVEDDGGDAEQAMHAVETLDRDGAVAIIGPSSDDAAGRVALSMTPTGTSLVLPLSSSPVLVAADNDRLFMIAPLRTMESVVLAGLAIEKKLSVGCVIEDGSADAFAMTTAFHDAFKRGGGKIRAPVRMETGNTGYEAALSACLAE
jgi:ABC-type branched-subunit amino acid transport system substrate-binding protein